MYLVIKGEIIMFLEEYKKKERTDIFEPDSAPKLARLSHSFDNPAWNYQYHIHKSETELVYIEDGSGTYTVNTSTYPLEKGCILIIEQGAIHALSSDATHPLNCWTCAITDYKLCDHPDRGFMLPANVCPRTRAEKHEDFICGLFRELDLLRRKPSPSSLTICDTLAAALTSVYYHIFRSDPQTERQKDSSFARDILIYINENYASPISLSRLADEFHISKDHISHEFSKVYGISPINYVIDRRLNEAKWMLINTSDSLVSISRKIGYENTSHFCHLFEKRMKYAPLEFREIYRKDLT